jgi:hypothetical protein
MGFLRKYFYLFFSFFLIFIFSSLIFALEVSPVFSEATSSTSSTSSPSSLGVALPNPLGTTQIPTIIGRVIRGVRNVVGSLALLMIIYGGFTWLTSGGNPDKVKKGKEIMVWAVFGLMVMLGSYIIVNYILTAITSGAGGK